jgi:putative membrane protein insertion efficiency factor
MIARLLVALIRLYQRTLSPLLGNVCRFEPSCSRYAVACLEGHGALRGSLLSIRRLCKCHPFHPGGYDPPPLKARVSSPVLMSGGADAGGGPPVTTPGASCAHD